MSAIEIDSREIALIESFSTVCEKNQFVNTKQLIIGDIIICSKLYIERKTWNDFYSSITTGRFSEQRTRLIETRDSIFGRIVYIVEGNSSSIYKEQGIVAVKGAIENLVLFHNIHVVYSKDVNDTRDIIYNYYMKLKLEKSNGLQKVVVTSRKSKILENIHMHQLAMIPGVSQEIACKLVEKYPSVSSLVKLCGHENACKELKEIVLSKRKLGPKLANKLYEIYK
jgi:ERCC4-type nuclease